MQLRGLKTWVSALAVLSLILWASLASAELPKNVILMISDGMGYNTVKATDYWTGSSAVYEGVTFSKYGMSTFSAGTPATPSWGYDPNQAWSDFNYVKSRATDSASAATAMATGIKNYDGQLNWSTVGLPLKTITEIASESGKATGVVTTVEWSHATPAGMFAHNSSRNNYSAIANEMLGSTSPLNVIMGAGNPQFNDSGGLAATPEYKYVGGSATWGQLLTASHPQGWSLIQTKVEFEALAANPNPTVTKVVGTVQAATTTQQARSGDVNAAPGVVPFNSNVPSLATMTKGALNVLNKDADGFFLMVEGGAVDWANHANQKGRMIEEQMDFNGSVQGAIDWVNANSNWSDTLLLVTADHECGHVWGTGSGLPATFNEVTDNGPNNLPGVAHYSGDHTNALVPLYAFGAGSELLAGYADQWDPKRGWYVDNTELFQTMNGNPVPIPGAVWLLGSGLAGLGLLRRRARLS